MLLWSPPDLLCLFLHPQYVSGCSQCFCEVYLTFSACFCILSMQVAVLNASVKSIWPPLLMSASSGCMWLSSMLLWSPPDLLCLFLHPQQVCGCSPCFCEFHLTFSACFCTLSMWVAVLNVPVKFTWPSLLMSAPSACKWLSQCFCVVYLTVSAPSACKWLFFMLLWSPPDLLCLFLHPQYVSGCS